MPVWKKSKTMAGPKENPFFNLYSHGFIRACVCVPQLRVADVSFNAAKTIELARRAAKQNSLLAVFPQLGLTACSAGDLFHQEALLDSAEAAVVKIKDASAKINTIIVCGVPLRAEGGLFNCAVVFYRGKILGICVKSLLPDHGEFNEGRHFTPAGAVVFSSVNLAGQKDIPFGANLIFRAANVQNLNLYFEIGEDAQAPIPPSSYAALAGATVIGNLSASGAVIGKARLLRQQVAGRSASSVAAYLYAGAGFGESTTDLAWDGQAIICENGKLLAEGECFSLSDQVICADIDTGRLAQERLRLTTFGQNAAQHKNILAGFRTVEFEVKIPSGRLLPQREIDRFPYISADPEERDRQCREAYSIQIQGLAKRLAATGIPNLVIGVSGGLDSAHALVIAVKTMDLLGRPRTNIKAYSMPAFGTSDESLRAARLLMKGLGVEANEIDIKPACLQMLKDIGHPFSRGKNIYDLTFENVQAGQRSAHLFRLAGMNNALVVGTGDLSEQALGWSTYGVGDHMSHYSVNTGVPKTMIQCLIGWTAKTGKFSPEVSAVLLSILDADISPELIPGSAKNRPAQKTEEVIGPYELQDFNNFYIAHLGFTPMKTAFLAWLAWRDKTRGAWPDVPSDRRRSYTLKEVKKWLNVFLTRFFQTSQYKRTCMPGGPKVVAEGSLSPRAGWRAPADSEAAVWLDDWKNIPEKDSP
jgi:NAD+ synthase (glutamine-hydrolysing)